MHDAIDARECLVGERGVADVAHDQLDGGREVGTLVTVDLRLEAVEDDDVVALRDQCRERGASR